MRKRIQDLSALITIGAGVFSSVEFVRRKQGFIETTEQLTKENELTIAELRTQKTLQAAQEAKKRLDLQESLGKLNSQGNDFLNEIEENKGQCISESCKRLQQNFKEAISKCKNTITEIDNPLDEEIVKSSIIPEDLIESYQKYIETLNDEELYSLLHVSFFLGLILLCFNLIGVFYGDYIIKYFNIENKFPKIAKYIELRRKFQFYYFSLNLGLIILILIFLLIFNILLFTRYFN